MQRCTRWAVFLAASLLAAPAFSQDDDAAEPAAQAPDSPPAAAGSPGAPARDFRTYATQQPSGAATGTPTPAPRQLLSPARIQAPRQQYPNIEWHGYFRFRGDSFWNLDLDTFGTSPILPPVESLIFPGANTAFVDSEIPRTGVNENGQPVDVSQLYDQDREYLGSANIRLRLTPIFHVTENASIFLEMNILDNMVMGATPDGFNELSFGRTGFGPRGFRTDMPLIGFTGGQEPPNVFSFGRNSVSVTQAYASVRPFFGQIRVGRMASHWGLGILANGGGSYTSLNEARTSYRGVDMAGHNCLDCDFGDYVDRMLFATRIPGINTYLTVAYDFNSSGPTDISLFEYYGQPRDISDADNVRSYVFALFQRPLQAEEIEQRNIDLKENRRPVFDWGAYMVYRTQGLSTEQFNAYTERTDYIWLVRNARALISDLWFRIQYEPRVRRRLRFETEIAAIYGDIENANPDTGSNYNPVRPRDIQQWGGAVEFEYQIDDLTTGFNAGFATGRTIDESQIAPGDPYPIGFGVIDQFSPNAYEPSLTNFRFDRNYFVDMIMFREIIGTITNAVYVNPFVQFDLFTPQDDKLGIRLDLIAGGALDPATTPSGERFYGVETDISLYWREPRYGADITAGLFIPGAAFDGTPGRPRLTSVGRFLNRQERYTVEDSPAATAAWTLQGRFFWAF